MRWDALFADMEAQLEAAAALGRAGQVADLTRAERASVGLADRLRAAVGREVRLTLRSAVPVVGVLSDAGTSWALVTDGRREHLVPLTALVAVGGLPDAAAVPVGAALRRLGLGHALRAVARDRALVRVQTSAVVLHGRLDAVGADHLDVALAFEDSGRPTGDRHAVTFAGLDAVTSL